MSYLLGFLSSASFVIPMFRLVHPLLLRSSRSVVHGAFASASLSTTGVPSQSERIYTAHISVKAVCNESPGMPLSILF